MRSTDPSDIASSYRPTSNPSPTFRIYQQSLNESLLRVTHISNWHLLPVQQSAYHPFHFTVTAVLSVHNDLVCTIHNGQVSLLVLLDLSAAFDTVDHSTLQSVLSSRFSVVNTTFSCFQSSLSDRSQSFVYAGQQAINFPVQCNVPQQSVLGL